MKIQRDPGKPLPKENLAAIQKAAKLQLAETPYYDLLRLIGEMYNMIAADSDSYLIIGTTKDRSAMCITVYLNGGRDSVYGKSIEEVSLACAKWLETR